ncbi:HEPN domain-containing protein [Ochrobactrum sp. WV_118_8]|uniref:HEPN domain-containing protein n=1 Tax=Brucella anthropi TaxID=529 RepID=UPI002157A19E|nr:HEPN domain-containing protein [Brucella anthropi]MCR8493162.1 HEPN domain-containing protein [Brucella anthropi]
MSTGNDVKDGDLFIGLSGLRLDDTRMSFSRGIVLETTFAHLMSPMTMAFAPPGPGGYHPAPWKSARGGFGRDITAQIAIPKSAAGSFDERMEIAFTLLFLLRLLSDPAVTMPAIANMPFAEIAKADDGVAHIVSIEHRSRYFELGLVDHSKTVDTLQWVQDYFETALKLRKESTEFRLASFAIDSGQFIDNTALVLISLWGALEALFSPSTSELRFRVSALIAAYLYPPGEERRDQQKRIASLYDKRSAAAHGKPSHGGDDLLATFELLRRVLIRFIREGDVPTKQTLENKLFGCN